MNMNILVCASSMSVIFRKVISAWSPFILRIPVSTVIWSYPILLLPCRRLCNLSHSVGSSLATGCVNRLLVLAQLTYTNSSWLCVGGYHHLTTWVDNCSLMHRLLSSIAQIIITLCIWQWRLILWRKMILLLICATVWLCSNSRRNWGIPRILVL